MRLVVLTVALLVTSLPILAAPPEVDLTTLARQASAPIPADTPLQPVLPRYREGGTPFDASQMLTPVQVVRPRDYPNNGLIASPPEYSPARGVLYAYVTGQWTSVVTQLVKELTNDPNCPTCDEIAYVAVSSQTEENNARAAFQSAGANLNKVKFVRFALNALWMRDYGPHFIWQGGTLALVDSHYYPERPQDNFVPTQLGDDYALEPNSLIPPVRVQTYDEPLYYSGGNFQPGPNRSGFMTSLINVDNPASEAYNAALIAEIMNKYQGIDTLNIMPQLPGSVDGTGHIDMWFYLVDEHNVIISQFKPGSNATAISITNNAVPFMQGLGFTVNRTPAWNVGSTHYTYTNAFRVNNRIFTIKYNAYPADNASAQAAWQAAAGPDVLLNPIECTSIIPAAGAIHCIVMQVPRYVDPAPAVHVIAPAGGELLAADSSYTIRWGATDTDNRLIPTIDLYYSYDDGATWQFITTTTNTGSYDWRVPNLRSGLARVKVVATALDSDVAEGVSAARFTITPANQHVYTFATGAGVDKFAKGYQTSSWTQVNTNRQPVSVQLSAANYAKIATSNATGGDSDTNRYIATNPSSSYESTHTFEFNLAEPVADVAQVELLWEGYAKNCTQVELYTWDYVQGRWGDGLGADPNANYGQNRFVDTWAGNRDGFLNATYQDNLDRLVSDTGQMTFLVYAHRGSTSSLTQPTFHDYVELKTTVLPAGCSGDMNCDGVVDFADIDYFVSALSGEGSFIATYVAANGVPPTCSYLNGDVNADGNVDFADIDPFVGVIGATCP